MAPLVGRGQPTRTDNRHQHLARCHRTGNFLGEINAQVDRVHIHEHPALAETISQAVIQAPGERDQHVTISTELVEDRRARR